MRFRRVAAIAAAVALVGACGGGRDEPAAAGSKDSSSSETGAASANEGGASSAATDPKAETTPPPLAHLLLSAKDLGDSWRERGYTIVDPATASLVRLCGRDVAIGASSVVGVDQPKEGNIVVHFVARFDTPEQARQTVQAVAEAGASCGQWDLEGANVKINPVNYALVGDGRTAFRMIVDGAKAKSNADYFVWYRGSYVSAVFNAASVLLDPEITKQAFSAADRRLVEKG